MLWYYSIEFQIVKGETHPGQRRSPKDGFIEIEIQIEIGIDIEAPNLFDFDFDGDFDFVEITIIYMRSPLRMGCPIAEKAAGLQDRDPVCAGPEEVWIGSRQSCLDGR
jgi:hypothetical protein